MDDIKKRKQAICNTLVKELVSYTSCTVVMKLLCNDFSPDEMIKEFGFSKQEVDEFFKEDKSE